jgi:iron complex outermembrane receptor protein
MRSQAMRTIRASFLALVVVLLAAPFPAAGQSGGTVSGKVTRETGDVMTGALVQIEELKRETRTGPDGAYRFENIPPGQYHLSVRAEGYTSRRAEVEVTPQGATVDLVVDLDLHFAEVVSVSPTPRPQFESYQPTSVLAGEALQQQLEQTVGATLQDQPGVAMRSLGPAPARPVIRGLDGDRVSILEDGQRTGDLSSQSSDHGVTINPAAARRIEVVRGPATLLYGANAIGGLVNVITNQIPTERVTQIQGNFTTAFGTNAGQAAGAGDVHLGNGMFAVHLGGGANRAGDFDTPDGEIDNSQSRSGFVDVGAAWTSERSYVGGSYGYDDSRYGVPFVEEGETELTPRRHAIMFRAGGQQLNGPFSSYRGTLAVRRYKHDELDAGEVATAFKNNTTEGDLLLSHRQFGRLSGTVGASFLDRSFSTEGAEALSPPVDQSGFAIYLYEELTWPHATVQFGARLDHTSYSPEGGLAERDFDEGSGSVGLLLRPVRNNDNLVVAASLARAARNPALEELYYFGVHPGNFAFEIGNPDIGSEHALGFDVSLRARYDRFHGEVTFFRNDISDFIFRRPLTEDEFIERIPEFEERFNLDEVEVQDEFPIIENTGADSLLWGFEAQAEVSITPELVAELSFDSVRGELKDTNEPLPRIPPYRVIPGLRWHRNALTVGGSVPIVGKQDRVFAPETETDSYALLRLYASYGIRQGRALHTITARLDNGTNELYRNHLNFLKDLMPEMGRSFKVVYSVGF